MKKLRIFFLILLVFSVFLPKTYAAEATNVTMYATSHSIVEPYNQINEYNNSSYIQIGDSQFIKFKVLQFNNINISKVCEGQKYYYRFDYQIWGWHNEAKTNRDWVNFAKGLFTYPNLNVLGSIIDIPNGYTLNISTFIEWELSTSSECVTENLDLFQLNFSDKLTDFYFYNASHTNSPIYTIYNSTYEITSPAYAQQLIDSYYDTGNINSEKLDEISGKLIDVNNNIQETNKKLEQVYGSINQTNEKLDDLNDNITNSDTSGSQNTANGFFNNFNTEDNGGISAIVTAPLKAINSMVDGTCQPLTATWRGKTISLPCGTEFWDKMSPIRTFLNVIEGGIICYGILVDLYKMINRMKDPEDDRVDVMKL